VRAAAADGAQLIVLPEKWNCLGTAEQLAAGAEPLDGPTIAWAEALAHELGIDLVAGSIVERIEGQDRCANTSVHIDTHGSMQVYRKIHLFDVEIGDTVYRESDLEAPGDLVVRSTLADGTGLGLSVCYDLRFPELYRALVLSGAQVIVVPSAFTLPTTRDHWEVLLRARAIENQCFLVAANQVGVHPPGNASGGRSMIVDPWGLVLALAPDEECYITADLELDRVAEVRAKLPALSHRQPAAYERVMKA
jgi:predicted amidohydrolase